MELGGNIISPEPEVRSQFPIHSFHSPTYSLCKSHKAIYRGPSLNPKPHVALTLEPETCWGFVGEIQGGDRSGTQALLRLGSAAHVQLVFRVWGLHGI